LLELQLAPQYRNNQRGILTVILLVELI